jgi:single-strand DNA-binding protein
MQGTVVGRLGKTPELKQTSSGSPMVTFSVAEDIYNRESGEKEGKWYSVIGFGRKAEVIAEHFQKGDGIVLHGEAGLVWVGDNGQNSTNFQMRDFDFPPGKGNGGSGDDFSQAPAAGPEEDPFL